MTTTDYKQYKAEDFASDEFYLSYYLNKEKQATEFWIGWINQNSEMRNVIEEANDLIDLLSLRLSKQEVNTEFDYLMTRISQHERIESSQKRKRRKSVLLSGIAATIILLIGLFLWTNKQSIPEEISGITMLCAKSVEEEVNLILPDGTKVILHKGAELKFPEKFDQRKRDVYLIGDAFFDVVPNPELPFSVFSGEIVTKVLGTSFSIKNTLNSKIEVEVLSGKVKVVENTDPSTEVIITPNQKAVYSLETKNFEIGLVSDPQISSPQNKVIEDNFVLDAIPLGTLLRDLSLAYNIGIEVQNEGINYCHFSGNISHMNLYEKLNVICKALNYTYEIEGTKIIIKGRGCKSIEN